MVWGKEFSDRHVQFKVLGVHSDHVQDLDGCASLTFCKEVWIQDTDVVSMQMAIGALRVK